MPLSQLRRPGARQGRGWAYTGAILGGAVSIAANVAHSYVPPEKAPADWSPHAGAVVGAVFWPVALFVAVEIFARIAWPVGRRWTALRFLGLLPVAVVAAVVSYRHLSGLLGFYGEDGLTVVIGPLAVDGLMVMATGALVATSRARVAALDVADSAPACRIPEPSSRAEAGTMVPAEAAAPGPEIRHGVADLILGQQDGPPVDHDLEVSKLPGAGKPSRLRPARRQTAADRVAKAAARTPAATPAQLAARLKLSERTVQRYLPRPEIANPRSQSGPADDTTSTDEQPSRRDLRDPIELADVGR